MQPIFDDVSLKDERHFMITLPERKGDLYLQSGPTLHEFQTTFLSDWEAARIETIKWNREERSLQHIRAQGRRDERAHPCSFWQAQDLEAVRVADGIACFNTPTDNQTGFQRSRLLSKGLGSSNDPANRTSRSARRQVRNPESSYAVPTGALLSSARAWPSEFEVKPDLNEPTLLCSSKTIQTAEQDIPSLVKGYKLSLLQENKDEE